MMGRMTERLHTDRARAELARQIAAYTFGVPVDTLNGPTRGGAEAAFVRQVAMYLAHIAFEMSLARVGAAFGRDRSTAAHACHVVEDRRDDRAFDALLDEMETGLRALPLPEAAVEACYAGAFGPATRAEAGW